MVVGYLKLQNRRKLCVAEAKAATEAVAAAAAAGVAAAAAVRCLRSSRSLESLEPLGRSVTCGGETAKFNKLRLTTHTTTKTTTETATKNIEKTIILLLHSLSPSHSASQTCINKWQIAWAKRQKQTSQLTNVKNKLTTLQACA